MPLAIATTSRSVLKVARRVGDEWSSGQILHDFDGRGVVRTLEEPNGAVLLERLVPGTPLAAAKVGDGEATAIIADVIRRMSPGPPPTTTPTVESWAKGLERYAATGAAAMPMSLVETAHRTDLALCASQATARLLHGDLHHHNREH